MQATVHRFDPATGDGALLTDDGLVIAFAASAVSAGGLRHVRQGQRLSIEQAADGTVVALRLGSIAAHGTA